MTATPLAGGIVSSSLSTATPPGRGGRVPSTGASATRSYPLAEMVCAVSVWLSRKSHERLPSLRRVVRRRGEDRDGGLDPGGGEHVVEQGAEGRRQGGC